MPRAVRALTLLLCALALVSAALLLLALSFRPTLKRIEHHMSQLSDLVTQINDETNAIAARIDSLLAGQDDPAAIAQLTAISARLKTLGANPQQPIPPPVPAPATP